MEPKPKKKKLNSFELLMLQQKLYEEHLEPSQIGDFPETVVETLRLFVKAWGIPSAAIPHKSEKSRYAQWVKELQKLNDLAGNQKRMGEALDLAYRNFSNLRNKFMISHPAAIQKLLIDALADMNRQQQALDASKKAVEREEVNQPATSEQLDSAMRELNTIFDDEE